MLLAPLLREASVGRQRPHLTRQLDLIDAIAVALGAIIGAGILVVLGEAAGGLAASVVLTFSLPLEAVIAVVAALAAGLAYYAWQHR